MAPTSEIVVRGAREHNLKGVDLRLPRGALITMTGVSGSGKSSLAFDTLYQEGRRRFVESLSSYARQFLGRTEKPKVEHLEGLSPAVSIDQKTVNRSPRSTVGTTTEIFDHLRLFFARLGKPHCPTCKLPVNPQSAEQIGDRVAREFDGRSLMILAPLVKDRKGEYRKELEELRLKGYVRARIDGEVRRLDEPIELGRYERHTIEVILDRVKVDADKRGRLQESIEAGLKVGQGVVAVQDGDRYEQFSSKYACPQCGIDLPEMEPRTFSFNSPHGACQTCDGLGETSDIDPGLIVPDPALTIAEGAIAVMSGASWTLKHHFGREVFTAVCAHFKIPTDRPWSKLTDPERAILLEGAEGLVTFERRIDGAKLRVRTTERRTWKGVIPLLREVHARLKGKSTEVFFAPADCRDCGGSRLRKEALAVTFRDKNIADLIRSPVDDLRTFLSGLVLEGREQTIGAPILKELRTRLGFLVDVGLGYLTVDRGTASLSGGESQRIRLATQVGSGLRGILYVLDEPSIGLHQRDNRKLIEALERLRDAGMSGERTRSRVPPLGEHDRGELRQRAIRLAGRPLQVRQGRVWVVVEFETPRLDGANEGRERKMPALRRRPHPVEHRVARRRLRRSGRQTILPPLQADLAEHRLAHGVADARRLPSECREREQGRAGGRRREQRGEVAIPVEGARGVSVGVGGHGHAAGDRGLRPVSRRATARRRRRGPPPAGCCRCGSRPRCRAPQGEARLP